MIKVDVMDICHHCVLFEPDSDAHDARNTVKLLRSFNNHLEPSEIETPDILVSCVHKNRCKYVMELVLNSIKDNSEVEKNND